MAQGKTKLKQRPGDSLKKNKRQSAITKKKQPKIGGAGVGSASNKPSSSTAVKSNMQKAINARIEVEVSQRAKANESRNFKLLTMANPGDPSKEKPRKKAKSHAKKKTKRK